MRTRYPRSRIVATLFGVWAGWILLSTIREFVSGPPTGGWVTSYGGFSWADPHPRFSFQLALIWETSAFGGTLLMWVRPRAGYFCAGMGYLLYLTLGMFDYYASSWAYEDLVTCALILGMFALPVWLFWLCVKDEPESSRRGRSLLASSGGSFFTPPGGDRRGTTS